MPVADQPEQSPEIRILDTACRRDIEHVVNDDRHFARNGPKRCGHLAHQSPVAKYLHDPAEFAHCGPKDLENIEPYATHVTGPAGVRKKMETVPDTLII